MRSTEARLAFVREKADKWSGEAVGDLSDQQHIGSDWSLCNAFEKVKEEVEPASYDQIIDEVTDSIRPEVYAL